MIEIIGKQTKNKSSLFLLPLTGINKDQKYKCNAYLFWNNYSINNYHLIVLFYWDNYKEFLNYCNNTLFPILDKNNMLLESFNLENKSIFILDMSIWYKDVEFFLKGKYSKFSDEAKKIIIDYHKFYDNGPKIVINISATLEPNAKYTILNNKTAIEYIAENYKFDINTMKSIGEIGSIYNKEKETLYDTTEQEINQTN